MANRTETLSGVGLSRALRRCAPGWCVLASLALSVGIAGAGEMPKAGAQPAAPTAPAAGPAAATAPAANPFEGDPRFVPANVIDVQVLALLKKKGIQPAALCTDQVFLRRVYLDMIGTLPDPEEVRAFMQDTRPNKRAALIDALMQRDEFADYWTLKWCDALRVKAEFPVNLWPNAVQAYHRWVHDAVRTNRPYDQVARDLLTSSGSNFRAPAVNFYRAIQGRDPNAIAGAVALTLMGARFDKWPEARRAGMAAFFSRISYRKTDEWKEEIVCLNPAPPAGPLKAVFPDGTPAKIAPGDDPRRAFADWLLSPKNPWFARAVANRVWAWVFGRGIIHEPDDVRPDNPPSNPALLACLEKELVGSHYDLRHLYRLILNSRTYQQASIPRSPRAEAGPLFAYYPVRRLDAEVLIDALCRIGGAGETYSSAIPEPYTFLPDDQRAIAIADGSITSAFLEMFGRPTRDTGLFTERINEPSDAQRLYLLNSADVQRKIERSPRLRSLLQSAGSNRAEIIRGLYLMVLSREPTEAEAAAAEAYTRSKGLTLKQATDDLVWALINTKEFLYRH